jgi:hypothetical protein
MEHGHHPPAITQVHHQGVKGEGERRIGRENCLHQRLNVGPPFKGEFKRRIGCDICLQRAEE